MTSQEIKTALMNGIYTVTFTKVDGTTRVMQCTLKEDLIPVDMLPKTKETLTTTLQNDTEERAVMSVWDLEKNAWRSFRTENVTNLEEVIK
jgi:hypothetical protein